MGPGDYMLTNHVPNPCRIDTPGVYCKSSNAKDLSVENQLLIRRQDDDQNGFALTPVETFKPSKVTKDRRTVKLATGEETKVSKSCNQSRPIDRISSIPRLPTLFDPRVPPLDTRSEAKKGVKKYA